MPPAPGPVASQSPSIPTPATPSSNTVIPPENVPLVPPPPPGGKVQVAPPTSIPPITNRDANVIEPTIPSLETSKTTSPPPPALPPSPPPPTPRRKRGRFRRFLLYLILFGGLSYAGGVYYSLVSDNFHDFFTEYIPLGEDAVFYFEEREFRKRFPNMVMSSKRPSPSDKKVTIPSKSGLSWRVAENQGTDLATKGRHMSALDANKPKPAVENAQRTPSQATSDEKTKTVEQAKKEAPPAPQTLSPKEPEKPDPKPGLKKTEPAKDVPNRAPEVDEPSVFMPISRIDPLNVKNAEEPLVQDLVKTLNDIITVVNADNAAGKYSSAIAKAKNELASVGRRILGLKESERQAAQEKIKSTQVDFDKAAKELVKRLEEEMRDQEGRWKEEFETEREKITKSYQERLQTELKRADEVQQQKLRNELLEQAVTMKKKFLNEVKDRVETERNGRLSKLSDLSSSVSELEHLSAEWNSVVDANLQNQHLLVAVEAVRSSLEQADRPRPFIHELAALKEVASNDPVIDAAIASINPTAYQRGVPTSAQLIDRFRRVTAEVRKASLLPEDAGVASYAASWALSKVLFKKQGMAVGDDVESILTRTELLLEEGNLDEAAREMNTLQGWAKKLSWDWLGECRRVLEVRQAVDVLTAEARLRSLMVQ